MSEPLKQEALPDLGWKAPAEILAETEDYAKQGSVVSLFRDMALQTFKARPADPARFLVSYLAHNYPVATSEVLHERQQRVVEKHERREEELTITVSHKDHDLQEYLVHEASARPMIYTPLDPVLETRLPMSGQGGFSGFRVFRVSDEAVRKCLNTVFCRVLLFAGIQLIFYLGESLRLSF